MMNNRTNKALLLLLLILLSILLAGMCGCTYEQKLSKWCARCPVVENTTVKDTTIIQTDTTTIVVPSDSSWYYAWINCVADSTGKIVPVITKEVIREGKKSRVSARLTDNVLKVDCRIAEDSIQVLLRKITRLKESHSSKTIVVPCPPLAWWKRVLMYIGGAALVYVVGRGAVWLLRTYTKVSIPFLR